MTISMPICFFFFFNDPATTEIYTLSLHDALPIFAFQILRNELIRLIVVIGRPVSVRPQQSLPLLRPIVLVVPVVVRSEEHTSELQSQSNLVCRLLLEKKKHDYVLVVLLNSPQCHE